MCHREESIWDSSGGGHYNKHKFQGRTVFTAGGGGVVFHGEETRDVTKPAEIHFREIWISDLTSV